jgi:solute carrier family 35 (GDP-fucose transporter), member C1
MCGFAVGMVNDYHKMATSTLGMALGVGSSFTTAVESIVVKKFMSGKTKEVGMWQMIYMTNFMALMIYLPLLWSTPEWTSLQKHLLTADSTELLSSFVKTSIVTGITTFLLTIATFLQISVTSPTTHMIVTAARGVAQSGLAVVILNELVSAGRVLGMACILGGSMVYGIGKEEARKEAKEGYQRVAVDEEQGKGELSVQGVEMSEKEKL